jgi:hypothetical protein
MRSPHPYPARETGGADPVFCLSVTHGRRRTWAGTAIGSVALAAVTLLGTQGCAPATPADAVAHASHSVSLAAAEAAYGSYLTASDAAAAAGNEKQALSIVTAAQWAQVKGQYTALASAGTPVPRYRYGKPTFYVPALDTYPEWFLVAVPRRTDTGSRLGPAASTLMVFAKATNGLPWTLSGTTVLGRPPPAIARDSDGYAIDVATTDPSLLLRPDVVGATQAAVVDDGPASPAAAVVSAGPRTNGLYQAQAAEAAAAQARGLQYQWLLQGAAFPQFELRLADGGALVFYGMYLNTTNEHANLAAGSPIPVPPAFTPLLAAPTEVGYHAVYANWTYEFAAIDPPATTHNAKLQVIAAQAAPSYGHAY